MFPFQMSYGWRRPINSLPFESLKECLTRMKREEELLECPVCWESFNLVENIPYCLWCGHTLCKNCILSLQWAAVKFPSIPIHLPLFISCPWCQLLSFRFVWKGNLRFPRKNFFLLWLVESANGDRMRTHSSAPKLTLDPQSAPPSSSPRSHHAYSCTERPRHGMTSVARVTNFLNGWRLHGSLQKAVVLFVRMTAKLPVVLVFLFIVLYVIPASAAILVVYLAITFLFALPSFLVLYFSYPVLDWIVREIAA
ncbi:uncharacterized protein LOC131217043 [Magnolia sinica]|uniref:uncharacterized protein LOC131217043 n=1 Tax=Magnolia sinica TaxID=86752 RepID=UPI002658AA6C|nr:uncharacterized protein LOC131217043 [Magnolia sinica]